MKAKFLLVVALLVQLSAFGQGLRLMWVGDSITDGGWGRSGGSMASAEERNQRDQNHLYGHSYMFFCAAELESRHPQRIDACFNRGISGYTLADLEARWEQDVEALQPDLLSVLIGTNDVNRHFKNRKGEVPFDLVGWEHAYRAYLMRTRASFPQLKLVLCTPFVMRSGRLAEAPHFDEQAETIARCADVVRRLAREFDATLVDFQRLFARLEARTACSAEHWIWDGIHPTPAGHYKMARLWLKKVD